MIKNLHDRILRDKHKKQRLNTVPKSWLYFIELKNKFRLQLILLLNYVHD